MITTIIFIFLILIGIHTVACAYLISKHRDINKIPKTLLGAKDIKRIKDTDGFLNHLIKTSYLVGFSTLLNGVVSLVDRYVLELPFLAIATGFILLIAFAIYGYQTAKKLPEFYL